jgi:peptidoglycan/LPS O-acetylase OafA/YrhL
VGARRTKRLDSITGARFIAAGLVFIFHIATCGIFVGSVASGLTTVTKSAGTIGVSFFFVLSCFVLTWSARPGDTYTGFMRRRLVKIYPNHLVTFCLAVILISAGTPAATAVRGPNRHLTTLESVLPSLAALAVSIGLAPAMHAWIESPAVRRWGRSRPVTTASGADRRCAGRAEPLASGGRHLGRRGGKPLHPGVTGRERPISTAALTASLIPSAPLSPFPVGSDTC